MKYFNKDSAKPNITSMIKTKRMTWDRNVARM